MHRTTPKVHLIAKTSVDFEVVAQYLKSIGAEDYADTIASTEQVDLDYLPEFAGRLCYQSWQPGINPNVRKVRTDSREYIGNVLGMKHGSVFEHASMTFLFSDVSRVFTHELVRHRAGVALSQESLRYVRLADLGFRTPEILSERAMWHDFNDGAGKRTAAVEAVVIDIVERLEDFQKEAAAAFGLDEDGTPFHYKKEVTSALRRLAPMGLSTNILWTANLRTLRHVIALRTSPGAEEEIRDIFSTVAEICAQEAPFCFQDMGRFEDTGAYVFANEKV